MILVAGATGLLGGLIARTLLDAGKPVRILERTGSPAPDLVAAGAEAVTADLKDPASLSVACAGVDAVVTTANAVGRGGDDTIESVDRQGNFNLVDAAAAEGVRHFVLTSVLGASAESPVPLLRARAEAEERLRGSGMAWTVLQPNCFMDLWIPAVVGGPAMAGQPVMLVGEGRRRHSFVAMRDVAAYAVAALDSRRAEGQTLVIGGPQPLSWRDVIEAFEHELGHPLTVSSLVPGQPVPGMPDSVVGLLAAMETYDSPIEMDDLASAYGVVPTPLADFVRDFVAGSRQQVG
jgi:NADH dehydrogenase